MVGERRLYVGTVLMALLGCGDDGTSSGSGAGGDGTTSSTGTSSTTAGPTTSSTSSAGGGSAASGGSGGTSSEGGGGSGQGGETFDSPCGALCADDPGCDEDPPSASGDCLECVLGEASQGTASDCTVDGAGSPCCQDDPACSELVVCVVSGGTLEECGETNPEGYAQAQICVLATCGECGGEPTGEGGGGAGGGGEGGGTFDSPCGAECADDPGCDLAPPDPSGDCSACVQAEADQGPGSDCALAGATGACCQDDPACSDYIGCVLSGGTQEACAQENPEGAEQARTCVLATCGECGGDGAGGGSSAPPCEDACAGDPGCAESPADPGTTCQECLDTETDAQSGCVIQAAVSPCCQDDPACAEFITCVQGGTDPVVCGVLNFAGAQRAQECIASSCGACGTPD